MKYYKILLRSDFKSAYAVPYLRLQYGIGLQTKKIPNSPGIFAFGKMEDIQRWYDCEELPYGIVIVSGIGRRCQKSIDSRSLIKGFDTVVRGTIFLDWFIPEEIVK